MFRAKKEHRILAIIFLIGVFFVTNNTPFFALTEEQATSEAIKNLKETATDEPATYPLEITYHDPQYGTRTKTIYVTITGINTTIAEEEVIDASDVEVDAVETIVFDDKDWIKVTGAKAWHKKTNATLPITKVDSSQVKMEPGTYPITFATKQGTQTTAQITVVPEHITYSTFWKDIYDWDTGLEKFFYMTGNILFAIIACLPPIYLLFEYTYLGILMRNIHEIMNKNFSKVVHK